jgi:hypothetical protein
MGRGTITGPSKNSSKPLSFEAAISFNCTQWLGLTLRMTESLEGKVASWLRDQGYPLEMEAAWISKSKGFDISQSDYYLDPEINQPREIDLVLKANRFTDRFNLEYSLFVECKSSRDKPWLLFSTENELVGTVGKEDRSLHALTLYSAFISNDLGGDLLLQSTFDGNLQRLYPRLDTEPTLGYGMTQAFSKETEVPFKALMSATKAALFYVKRFGTLGLSIPFLFATPVVVIDVPLLSVVYTPGSPDLDIREVRRGLLHWKHVVAGRSRIGVYIVNRAEIDSFMNDCYESATWWINANDEKLAAIYSKKYPEEVPREIM